MSDTRKKTFEQFQRDVQEVMDYTPPPTPDRGVEIRSVAQKARSMPTVKQTPNRGFTKADAKNLKNASKALNLAMKARKKKKPQKPYKM